MTTHWDAPIIDDDGNRLTRGRRVPSGEGDGINPSECHHCLSTVAQDAPWPNSVDSGAMIRPDARATGCGICDRAIRLDGLIVLCDDCLDDMHSGLADECHGADHPRNADHPDHHAPTRYPDGWHLIARANVYVERGFVIHANRGGVMWTREG